MNASLPEVTETIADAASEILSHSFAVYRVEAATAAKIRAANRTAVGFFRETRIATTSAPSDDVTVNNNIRAFLERHRRVKNGNLYGYNVPLQSKELFRTWYQSDSCFKTENNGSNKNNDQEEEELEYFRDQQPWPSNEFCVASFHLAKDLHRLLLECLQQMTIQNEKKDANEHNDMSLSKPTQDHSQQRRKLIPSVPPPRKRFRVSSNATPEPFDNESDNDTRTNIGNDGDEKTNMSWLSSLRPSCCPLDFFFYHNRIPNAVNCSEHVDRGALVVVCLTDVPGLEVRSSASQTSSFHCPEVLIHNENLYRERTDDLCCPGIVCIMAGDQLSRLLSSSNAADAATTTTPRACVHRVRNPLNRPRLSISYELRFDEV
jgi:hypothetical protein